MNGPSDVSRALPAAKPAAPTGARSTPTEAAGPKDAASLGQLREPTGDMAEMLENMKRNGWEPPAPQAAPAPQPEVKAEAAAPPAPPSKRKLVVEMEVDPNLDMSNLEPAFVKSSDLNSPVVVSAPTVLNAFDEAPMPDGQVAKWAPIPVDPKLIESGEIANYHGALVPNDAAPTMSQSEFAKKLEEQYQAGHKDALPPGMVPRVADSKAGLSTQKWGGLAAQLVGEVGGQFATTSLAGIWKVLPLNIAGPIGLVAGTVQTFGPNGHLKDLKDIQDQKGWLETYRDKEGKDKINLAVGPKGTLVPTATDQPIAETLKNLDATELSTKIKLGGSGLLAGAGIAAIVGGTAALAAPVLATGAMLAPIGAGLVTQKRQFDNLREQKKVLEAFQAQGQTTTKVPMADANGNIREVEMPIDKQIEALNKQIKMSALTMSISGTSAGIITAIALGAPVLMAMGGLALPAAIGVAMFPKETLEFIKQLPEKAWSAIKAVGEWIGEKFSRIFGGGQEKGLEKAGETAPAGGAPGPESPTVLQLRETAARFRELDPEATEKLQDAVGRLNTPPTNADEVKAYQAATEQLNAALATLGEKDPEAVKAWTSGMEALRNEQVQQVQQNYARAIEEFMAGPGAAVLGSTEVKEAQAKMGVDDQSAAGLLSHMVSTQLTGDGTVLRNLAETAQKGDQEALKLVQFGEILSAAYGKLAQQQATGAQVQQQQ